MTIQPTAFAARIAAAMLVCVIAAACSKQTDQPAKAPARVPVLAGDVVTGDAPLVLKAIGTVQPVASVIVKPQVNGQISEVHFQEGQDVKTGDLLFTIDKRPFEVALQQARATLEQARANAANAQEQVERYDELKKRGAVAAEQSEQIRTTARTTKAAVDAAEAAVQSAGLQLEYCTIRAPISGRAGKVLVDPGNVVTANQAELVTINQIQPIEVSFFVAERYLADLQRYFSEGALQVAASPEGRATDPARGNVTFIDNAVKSTSGTIEVKATFPNEDQQLWPGRFVDVQLTLTTEKAVTLAPSEAVLMGQQGQYVLVVKGDQTVEARPVKVSRTFGNWALVREGLQPGEKVVTDGQTRIAPGSKVEIKPSLSGEAPKATAAAASTEEKSAR